MKTDGKVSRDVIDRRKHAAVGALGGFVLAIGVVFGWRVMRPAPDPERNLVEIVSTALDRGQDFWSAHVAGYRRAQVVLFEGSTSSGCGRALATSGPFYCPADERIYVDLDFVRSIDGPLARAYVIEHELGHHVQNLRGELGGLHTSMAIELEADCYAGMLMHVEELAGHLDVGDIEGALLEAAAVGDDRLNPGSSPEQWTHGSSGERVGAVRSGLVNSSCTPVLEHY